MTEQRRLAAIVSADVAGYSRLMGRDESGTLAALKALRQEVVDPAIARHAGRIVKTTGDGLLLEFPSVVGAVRCVIEFQAAMANHNAEVPQDRRIEFRVGVNIGDIIIEGRDIFGDGVNVAARLQEIAAPGGVCVSESVHQQVRDKLETTFTNLGEQQFKNIARPVRTWWVQGLAAPTASTAAGERTARPTLAVLPFDGMGGDTALESFCGGLSEDLITNVSGIRWVSVVSRKSSFAYKERFPDVRQMAQELGATYVLEGTVRRAGDRVRITAQLINAHTGTHTWARRYDRDLGDLFELQDDIVRHIAGALDYVLWYRMVRGDAGAGAPDPIASPLRAAAWHITQLTATDNRLAITCAQRVLQLNPRSVAAWQYLVLAYVDDVTCGWSRDAAGDAAAAVEAGRQAAALSPADSLSHALFAVALALKRDRDNALASSRRALETRGFAGSSLGVVAETLSIAGDAQEGNEMIDRVLDLIPAHYFRPQLVAQMALNWLRLGAPERGLPFAEEAVKLKPEAPITHVARTAVLAAIGRMEEAQAALAAAFAVRPDLDRTVVDAMIPYSDPVDAERLHQALRAAGLRGGKV
jgi:adenylate cyclase